MVRGTRKCLHALQHAIEIWLSPQWIRQQTDTICSNFNLTAFSLRSWRSCQTFNMFISQNQEMLPTSMAKWCEYLFPLYSVEFLNLSDDNNSHQSFLWVTLKAARFIEKHNGLLRHSNVQSNTSDTATVPISGAFKWWNSCLMNVRVRKVLVEETRLPSRYTGFESVTRKNSPVIKGHDGSTHRKEWRGRDLLITRDDEAAYNSTPPPIPFKIMDVFHIYVTLMNLHLVKSTV